MQEGRNDRPLDELLSYDLYPYFRMMDEGLLDGIMPGHRIISAVDTERIASLSKKVMGLLREGGVAAALAGWLKKPLSLLFRFEPGEEAAMEDICMNLSADMLGMGSAATAMVSKAKLCRPIQFLA